MARESGGVQLLSQTMGPATEVEQERLQLAAGGMVLRTTRVRRFGTRVLMYEICRLAVGRLPGLEVADAGNYDICELARRHGTLLGPAQEHATVVPVFAEAASRLCVAPQTPLLQLDRVIFVASGQPVEWRIGLCRPPNRA